MESNQSEVVKKHFESIDDYDTCSDYVVPWNDEIQETVYRTSLRYLSWKKEGVINALDLGVGTARGGEIFLANNACRLTGIDFSEKMLEKAENHLQMNNMMQRIQLINADFTNWQFPAEEFDLCFSAIAIHNATHEEKAKLFKNIYSALKPGGVFVNGDFIESESQEGQKSWENYHRTYMDKHLNGGELRAWLRHAFEEDKPAKLSDQQKWIAETGFKEYSVLWQKNNLAVYFARK